MENRVGEEVAKKRAVKFYVRLSTDETFLTNPPVVLNTNTMEVYNSCGS